MWIRLQSGRFPMSANSYGPGLVGTTALTDILGLIEATEGYGTSSGTLGQPSLPECPAFEDHREVARFLILLR
jgi:hypothetical protein